MNKDKIGIFLSAGCLLHCILTPVIIPILPLLGLTVKHEALLHIVLAGVIMIVGAVTFIPGYRKHKDFATLLLGIISTSLIIGTGLIELMSERTLTALTIIGSLGLIGAHYNNHIKICACEHHHATD
jgi:hypothetical protein